MTKTYSHRAGATASQGERFVISTSEKQESIGTEWIAAAQPWEVRR